MVIAYEDYPWKNPLRIYWASVTGSRKVSSSQPTPFQLAHDPTLLVSIIDGPSFLRTIWDDEPWISANDQGSVGQDGSAWDGPRPSSSSWYWKIQALWKLLWLLNLFQVYFQMFQVFKIPKFESSRKLFFTNFEDSKLRKIQNRRTWPSRNGSL